MLALAGKVKLEMDEKGFMLIKSATEVYMQLPVVNRAAKPKKDNTTKEAA